MMTMTQAGKGYKGIGMDGVIATWYAGLTKKNMPEFERDAQTVASSIREGAAVLEVAPGPGYLAIALGKLGRYRIAGLDISRKFVEIAQENARRAGVDIDFRHGDASAMPFGDASFDFIVCRAAFKNFAAPVRALDEMHRVLRPGGRALILDLRADASEADIDNAVDAMGLSPINRFITRWTFRNMLIKRAYSREQFAAVAAESTFKGARIEQDALGLEVWLEK
jgi:ubiquinone/menaquinone biosynthesis C-methylase UbiE